MTIRVANLPSQSTEQDVKNLFAECGKVRIIEFLEDLVDVELENQEIEDSAIAKLDGRVFQGNTLSVSANDGDRGIKKERHGSSGSDGSDDRGDRGIKSDRHGSNGSGGSSGQGNR